MKPGITERIEKGQVFYSIAALLFLGSMLLFFRIPTAMVDAGQTSKPETIHVGFRLQNQTAEQKSDQPDQGASPESTASSSQAKEQINQYLARVLAKIERNKRYPLHEKSAGKEGIVKLRLVLSKSGQVSSIQILEPGSSPGFAIEAASSIRRAQPFGPVPEDYPSDQVSVTLNLQFRLK